MVNITCFIWIVLSVVVLLKLIKWEKKFADLFNELEELIRGDDNAR